VIRNRATATDARREVIPDERLRIAMARQ
jgi:hypothetical protein